jgi:hypothetical protein
MSGGCAAAIRAIGESPDRKLSIGILVIGISGILVTRGLGISESRSLKPRQGEKCHCGRTKDLWIGFFTEIPLGVQGATLAHE